MLHELGRAVKSIEQRQASGNNRVDHQLMTALGEYCLHLITEHVMEKGNECAGACVHDDVGLGRLAGDLFNQVIKASGLIRRPLSKVWIRSTFTAFSAGKLASMLLITRANLILDLAGNLELTGLGVASCIIASMSRSIVIMTVARRCHI